MKKLAMLLAVSAFSINAFALQPTDGELDYQYNMETAAKASTVSQVSSVSDNNLTDSEKDYRDVMQLDGKFVAHSTKGDLRVWGH
ncbi:hypothetical protein A4G18_04440 [Pasteurellaceae bacterium Pebbles2]|nr:hypothetical protein [Pasteurellaceae bacterium Pebbles2]